MEPKIFIGPMSKNLVDVAIELNNEFPIAFIPSRRQVEYDGGYVNKWTTEEFTSYVKTKNKNIIICRDHGGPVQGKLVDDGYTSLTEDCKYMDIIHIDPWKCVNNIKEAAKATCSLLTHCFTKNPNVLYEIGTEEAIFKYEPNELKTFLNLVKKSLTAEQFDKIKYVVVQSGTGLDLPGGVNTGTFDGTRLKKFINVVKEFGKLSKEHNGDFLTPNSNIAMRFNLGLDAINIAPEFGRLESEVYINELEKPKKIDFELADKLYNLCKSSNSWKKWAEDRTLSPKEMICTAGHYVFSHERFKEIKEKFPNIDNTIKAILKERLYEIHQQATNSRL